MPSTAARPASSPPRSRAPRRRAARAEQEAAAVATPTREAPSAPTRAEKPADKPGKRGRGGSGEQIDDVALASLLSSRICHDLVGPVGALSNGVEFLGAGVENDTRDHAVRVIRDGARTARARLQFYRSAFGAGGSIGDHAQLDEMRILAADFLEGGRVTLDWATGDATLDRPLARLLLNQILIGVEALPRGGLCQVGVVARGALNMVVMAEGPHTKLTPTAESLLRDGTLPPGERLEPRDAPLLLTHRLAGTLGASLTLAHEDGRVVVAYTI